jgi:succinyl-CoA synthetase beta subunit
MQALAKAYTATDATMLEINPFVITEDGRAVALDAKMDIDDNALYRHADFVKLRDLEEEEPLETDAIDHGLNYIKLDGNVGCMVNGAGLAMATMDIIQYAGGSPANFLDLLSNEQGVELNIGRKGTAVTMISQKVQTTFMKTGLWLNHVVLA